MGEAVLFSSAANTACPISPTLSEMHNEIFNLTMLLNTILSLQKTSENVNTSKLATPRCYHCDTRTTNRRITNIKKRKTIFIRTVRLRQYILALAVYRYLYIQQHLYYFSHKLQTLKDQSCDYQWNCNSTCRSVTSFPKSLNYNLVYLFNVKTRSRA